MLKTLTRRYQNRGPAYVPRRTYNTQFSSALASNPTMAMAFDAYSTNGLIFQIVSRQATAAAEASWALYEIGKEEPITEPHDALKLWTQPNPFTDQNEFVKQSVQHYLLAGECCWYSSDETTINGRTLRIPGGPAELWTVRPDRLEPVTDPVKYLEGWAYRNPDGKWEPWRVDQVIQTKLPNPKDPFRGLGAAAAVMADLYSDRAATEYQNAFFRNDGSAGDIIRFPERLTDEQFDEFVTRWNQQHQGPSNTNKIGFIEVAEYIERKNTMRDMQFTEGRKQTREFIREGFGYPVAMLGTTEDVNKAAAQAAELIFKNRMVRPILCDIQSTLNTKLLPRFRNSDGLEFRFETPDLSDEELEIAELDSKANRAKTLIDAGYDPDDVAAYVGLPKMGYSKPEKAPQQAINGPESASRRASDPAAKAIWERAQQMREERPSMTWEAISGFLGVSERTLRRYQAEFRAD